MEDSATIAYMNMVNNMAVKSRSCQEVCKGTVLINKSGTTEKSLTCPNCKSWIHHWEVLADEKRPADGVCPICGCNGLTEKGDKAPIFGCHVVIKDDSDQVVYIAPLCQCCNNKSIGTEMTLRKDIVLVRANVSETCEKLRT